MASPVNVITRLGNTVSSPSFTQFHPVSPSFTQYSQARSVESEAPGSCGPLTPASPSLRSVPRRPAGGSWSGRHLGERGRRWPGRGKDVAMDTYGILWQSRSQGSGTTMEKPWKNHGTTIPKPLQRTQLTQSLYTIVRSSVTLLPTNEWLAKLWVIAHRCERASLSNAVKL